MGNVIAPCTTRMTLVTPPARSGVGSAMQNTVRQVAAAIGIAVIASAVAVVYANGIEQKLPGFPPEVVDQASDSIGATHGLINAAVEQGRVTVAQADALLAQADEVFLNSLGVASLLAVLLILTALVLVVLRLPATPEVVAWGANAEGAVVDPAEEAADAAAAEGPAPVSPPGD
jgi:hypothetical protein